MRERRNLRGGRKKLATSQSRPEIATLSPTAHHTTKVATRPFNTVLNHEKDCEIRKTEAEVVPIALNAHEQGSPLRCHYFLSLQHS